MLDIATVRGRGTGESAMQAVLYAESVAGRNGPVARLLGLHPLPPAARLAYEDALAALAVGDALTALGPRWDVLHDIPLGDGRHLDHLILGPAGVFALRAVHVAGPELVVDGDQLAGGGRMEDLGRLRIDAGVLAERFAVAGAPIEVRPAAVIVGDARCVVRLPARSIQVVALAQVERWLSSRRKVLGGEEVAALSDMVDRWPDEEPDHDARERFELLRQRVRAAGRRRSVVVAAGFALGFAGLWASVGLLAATVLSA